MDNFIILQKWQSMVKGGGNKGGHEKGKGGKEHPSTWSKKGKKHVEPCRKP